MPLVSVIIPTYNRAPLLKEAISSVRSQTFVDWELIVVDDGSEDDTAEVVLSFSKKDLRIRYFKNAYQKGPAGARKYGIYLAKGDYIAFLDSDDLWKPWHLARGIYFLETYKDISWFYADVEILKNSQIVVDSVKKKYWSARELFLTEEREKNFFVFNDKNFLFKALKYEIFAGLQTSILRRSLFNIINFDENIRIGEDKLLVYEAILAGCKFAYLLEIHATYRIHSNHLSNVDSEEDFSMQINKLLEYAKFYQTLLKRLPISKKRERKVIIQKLADLYFWDIGYSILWQKMRSKETFSYFYKALVLYPLNPKFWKTFFLCGVRWPFIKRYENLSG